MFVNNFQARRTKHKIDQQKKGRTPFMRKPCNKTHKNCTMQNTP